ncbi:MAG: segregation ATPase, FtsK/SpoIIIE family [Pedosphaera sp.]|nr:segregation ATPase, FtsK/SpoIIIE family [Pedosphaera sp.]
MSNHLEATRTLELLDNLKQTVRDFAAQEAKLNQELSVKTTRERKQYEEALAIQEEQFSADFAQAESSHVAAKTALESKFEKRKSRIFNRAHKSSKEQAFKKIEDEIGARKYEIQKQTLQLEQDQKTGITTTEANFEDFKNNLALEQGNLEDLENTARRSFGNRLLTRAQSAPISSTADEHQLLIESRELLARSRTDLKRLRSSLLSLLFRFLPIWLLVPACAVPFLLQYFHVIALTQQQAIGISVGALVLVLVLYFVGKQTRRSLATSIANTLAKARKLQDVAWEKSEARHAQELDRINNEFKVGSEKLRAEWKQGLKQDVELKNEGNRRIYEKYQRVSAHNESLHSSKLGRLEQEYATTLERLQTSAASRKQELATNFEAKGAKLNSDYQAQWQALETDWNRKLPPIYEAVRAANAFAAGQFPPWTSPVWTNWTPPKKFADAAKFGELDVDVEKLAEALPKDRRLALPGPARFPLPFFLTYPGQGSILMETSGPGHDEIIGTLNNIVLRLLSIAPPGKANFTIIDPVGLGQSFAGVMHLADYEDRLINSRIWTQAGQIEEKLGELNEHMEKIIQMYLRNEYQTIAEYNQQAGNMAEKYHFLVIADFPVNFSEAATRRLLNIVASGARCGVYTLIHWDQRQTAPQDFVPDDLRKNSVGITRRGNDFIFTGKPMPGTKLLLDAPPAPEFAIDFIQKVGKGSKDSSRVEVPFSQVAPQGPELWTEETTSELRVPIGRTGATKLQYLAIGKGTRQHALIAGKTGSGKSTLFHVIITNLALWCSPEQVEFYLIDFKKGVEFKCYASNRLPHARVVAIESDREFGLSVLQRVDDELRRRGDLFRKLGVQDIAGYKRAGGTEPVPRSLLMIDEFQELFTEEDKVSQSASVLLDRIVRQGRAFGIHVILGSQTLGGAYTVARTTLGQMVIRIALQCNEADAYLIMDDNNPAPRLLSRPGEGIYNDAAGAMEGNSPFQAVWLSDEERDACLAKVRARADQSSVNYPGPIVFEGDAPADVRENPQLQELLAADSIKPSTSARIWLGAPNSIKGPTEAVFQRQSGNNLLIVGQREDAAMAILSVALVSLAAQYPPGAARFIVFDGNPPDSSQREFLNHIVQAIPQNVTMAKYSDLADTMNNLVGELKTRTGDSGEPATFLFFHGLQKFTKLRQDDDFSFSSESGTASPGAQLATLLSEGASLGIHIIATCDSYNNVNRFLSRKMLTEFEMRVLFQMSANDSASLIDTPKANTLGMHRALFYNEKEGYLEVFRPYALPDNAWIEQVTKNLLRLLK